MRTRSQPLSPSGYHVLEDHRPSRTRPKRKIVEPSYSQSSFTESSSTQSTSSVRVTRSQRKRPTATEYEQLAESETSELSEATKSKSDQVSHQKGTTSKRTYRSTGKGEATASDPSFQTDNESVAMEQNAATDEEVLENNRSLRKTKAKAKPKATSRRIKTPIPRNTRSQSRQSRQLDVVVDDITMSGEGSGRDHLAGSRPSSRVTPQADDGIHSLQSGQIEPNTYSEGETPITPIGYRSSDADKGTVELVQGRSDGKENLSPNIRRKRHRSDSPESMNYKRRNIGPSAFSERPRRHVPFLGRRPFRPSQFADSARRRQAERSGRRFSTLFYLPEHVFQAEADRQRQGTEATLQQSEPNMHEDSRPIQPVPDPVPSSSFNSQSSPVTPRRGWSIRGLLDSIPRPLSRFIPGLGSMEPVPNSLHASEGSSSPNVAMAEISKTPVAPTVPNLLMSSELPENGNIEQNDDLSRSRDSSPSESDLRYRERLEEFEKNIKREQIGDYELTYSLFPRPWDTRRFLKSPKRASNARSSKDSTETISRSTPTTSEKQTSITGAVTGSKLEAAQSEYPNVTSAPKDTADSTNKPVLETVDDNSTNSACRATLGSTPLQKKEKKRKRAPSPDVIPNPPGCSYGMDLDYFYIDESEESEEDDVEQADLSSHEIRSGTDSASRPAIRASQTILPPSKRVRFDASPQDSPSKVRARARATDPYSGRHFAGPGERSFVSDSLKQIGASTVPDSGPITRLSSNTASVDTSATSDLTPAPPAVALDPVRTGTLVGHPSTNDLISQSASNHVSVGPVMPPSADALDSQPTAHILGQTHTIAAAVPASDQVLTTPAEIPSTPSKREDEVVAKARSQVERFKPKTPSALRTTSRYSSPLNVSPGLRSNECPIIDFGDDEIGRDAQWLYEMCPSGRMEELKWPSKKKVIDSLGIDNKARQLLVKTWNNLELDDNHSLFCRVIEEGA